jgi:hypothetical protein
MATTGAPWNLFYPLGTDLVKDGAGDIQQLAEDAAGALTAVRALGLGTNVVQAVKTDVFTTSSASFTALTGLSASIVPSSSNSKILVVGHINLSNSGSPAGSSRYRLMRGATAISVGDAAGTRDQATGSLFSGINRANGAENVGTTGTWSFVFVDSPSTGSSVTYSCQVAVSAGTLRINATGGDTDAVANARTTSSITLIEVAA